MGTLCSSDTSKNDPTKVGDENNHIEDSEYQQPWTNFKAEGDDAMSSSDYLQAAFHYFKYWKVDKKGQLRSDGEFQKAIRKAGEEAAAFDVFLEEKWAVGLTPLKPGQEQEYGPGFNKNTKWGAAKELWKQRREEPDAGVQM